MKVWIYIVLAATTTIKRFISERGGRDISALQRSLIEIPKLSNKIL